MEAVQSVRSYSTTLPLLSIHKRLFSLGGNTVIATTLDHTGNVKVRVTRNVTGVETGTGGIGISEDLRVSKEPVLSY